MNFNKRPTSVSVIAWILISVGILKLVLAPFGFTVPRIQKELEAFGMALNTAVLWQVMLGAICIVSGAAMLKGLNWGRLLCLIIVPISLISGWLFYKFIPRDIWTAVIYIIVLVLLISPPSSRFFAKEK